MRISHLYNFCQPYPLLTCADIISSYGCRHVSISLCSSNSSQEHLIRVSGSGWGSSFLVIWCRLACLLVPSAARGADNSNGLIWYAALTFPSVTIMAYLHGPETHAHATFGALLQTKYTWTTYTRMAKRYKHKCTQLQSHAKYGPCTNAPAHATHMNMDTSHTEKDDSHT